MALENQITTPASSIASESPSQEIALTRSAAELAEQVRMGVGAQLTLDGIRSELVWPASALNILSILSLSGQLSPEKIAYWSQVVAIVNNSRAANDASHRDIA